MALYTQNQKKKLRDDFISTKYAPEEDPNSKYNRYKTHLADFRENQKLAAVSQRELEMQALQNKGQTDVQGLQNVGNLNVTNAKIGEGGRQFDMTNRLEGLKFGETQAQNLRNYGMEGRKFGLNERKFGETKAENLRRFGVDKQKARLNEYTTLGEMANPAGFGYSPEATGNALAGFGMYGDSQNGNGPDDPMDLSIRQAVATGQPLSEAQSIYVRQQNQGQQSQPGVPVPMGMQGQDVVAPVTPKPNQRETNESIYGSRPTLKSMWDIEAKRKAARDTKRKSQWTTMY